MTVIETPADLLRKVADKIERHPDQWNQGTWCQVSAKHLPDRDHLMDPDTRVNVVSTEDYARYRKVLVEDGCGTAACVAGWAALLTERGLVGLRADGTVDPAVSTVDDQARVLLGIDFPVAGRLFNANNRSGYEHAHLHMAAMLRELADLHDATGNGVLTVEAVEDAGIDVFCAFPDPRRRVTGERLSPPGRFNPLAVDHPGVGSTCPACNGVMLVGDVPALYEVGPADAEEAAKAEAGRVYTAECLIGHEVCP